MKKYLNISGDIAYKKLEYFAYIKGRYCIDSVNESWFAREDLYLYEDNKEVTFLAHSKFKEEIKAEEFFKKNKSFVLLSEDEFEKNFLKYIGNEKS